MLKPKINHSYELNIGEESKIFSSCFLKELEKHYRDFHLHFMRPHEKFTSWAAQHSTRQCTSSLQYQWILLFFYIYLPQSFLLFMHQHTSHPVFITLFPGMEKLFDK